MKEIKELLKKEDGPNKAVALAMKLGITEAYVRMLEKDKASPGWRLKRDIDRIYYDMKNANGS